MAVGRYTLPATQPQDAPTMTDIDLSGLAADRDGPRAPRPLLRSSTSVQGPSRPKTLGRIELFFSIRLN